MIGSGRRFRLNMGGARITQEIWVAPSCAFSGSIYGVNIFIYLKENTKFRYQVTSHNFMEYNSLRL